MFLKLLANITDWNFIALLASSASAFVSTAPARTSFVSLSMAESSPKPTTDFVGNNLLIKEILETVQEKGILSKVASSGLLSKAKEAGVSLKNVDLPQPVYRSGIGRRALSLPSPVTGSGIGRRKWLLVPVCLYRAGPGT